MCCGLEAGLKGGPLDFLSKVREPLGDWCVLDAKKCFELLEDSGSKPVSVMTGSPVKGLINGSSQSSSVALSFDTFDISVLGEFVSTQI